MYIVTGIDVYLCVGVMLGVCTVYTALVLLFFETFLLFLLEFKHCFQ